MANAATYLEETRQLISKHFPSGQIPNPWTTEAEAKMQKRSIVQLQKELRVVKKKIAIDKRSISSDFSSQRSVIGTGVVTGLAAGFFGRRNIGMLNAARKKDLRIQQLQVVSPLNDAINKIDDVLNQLDMQKNEIDKKLLDFKIPAQ